MAKPSHTAIDYRSVELDGLRYVILRESVFEALCRRAGIPQPSPPAAETALGQDAAIDRATLAEKISRRRRACGLSQAELARRAGIRPETLNRIERGHTTPDFATVRKLAVAMAAAETERVSTEFDNTTNKESEDERAK